MPNIPDDAEGHIVIDWTKFYVGPWHAMVAERRPGCKATGPLCVQHCQEPCEDEYELDIQHLSEDNPDGRDLYTCRMEPRGEGSDGEYYDWYHVNCDLGKEYDDSGDEYFRWPDEACYSERAGPVDGQYRVRYVLEGPDYWGEYDAQWIEVQMIKENES